MRNSIRLRLVGLLSAIYVVVAVAVASSVYVSVTLRLERTLDGQLAEAAEVLYSLLGSELYEQYAAGTGNGEARDADGVTLAEVRAHLGNRALPGALVYQVELGRGHLVLRSAQAPSTPLAEAGDRGLLTRRIDGRDYRVCVLDSPDDLIHVRVAQPLSTRDAHARQFARATLIPLAVGAFFTVLLAAIGIEFCLRPLRQFAERVDDLAPRALTPVDLDGAPSEVKVLGQALNTLLARVQQTFALERRFTADAAHELRTPLAAIRAQAQLVADARDEATRAGALARITTGVDAVARLLDQLLLLARLDVDDRLDPGARADLCAVLREALAAHQAEALRRDIDVGAACPEHLVVAGDPQLLGVLWRNLVENALRHAPPGTHVNCTVTCEGDEVVLCVEDQGPGIAADERERLLRRFQRGAGVAGPGAGLGLSIVARVVAVHGGRLMLDDAPGGGLRVTIRLPRT